MAASKSYFPRTTYRFLPTERNGPIGSDSLFELHESEVWNSAPDRSVSPDFQKLVVGTGSRLSSAGKRSNSNASSSSSSLPVNVPDWSKILKHEYRENRRRESEDEEEEEGQNSNSWVPPHEFLARQVDRTRVAFSVHEGIGRTLKGRDLSRVRNAIFEKTGFQD